jgi:hypothetical protein
MDRFLLVCLLIFSAICAIIIIDITLAPPLSVDDNRAISIALADPGVKIEIANNQGNYKVVSVTPQGQDGRSGFINISDTLVAVNLSVQGTMIAPDRYIAFVDLNQSKVVSSEWYSYRGGLPASFDITLSPGASYYHALNSLLHVSTGYGEAGIEVFVCHLDRLYPENAKLYPILVDGTNLSLMKTGSNYGLAVYNDTNTGKLAVLNGTYQIHPGWSINASVPRQQVYDTGSWPDYDYSVHYYIVLKNPGPDTIRMTIGM